VLAVKRTQPELLKDSTTIPRFIRECQGGWV
jgi:hypothetical protein